MERRSDLLIQELKDLLGTDEVYFQASPDAGTNDNGEAYLFTGIKYPCFIMERTTAYQPKANDKTYLFRHGYQVTYINRDEPDPEMIQTSGVSSSFSFPVEPPEEFDSYVPFRYLPF